MSVSERQQQDDVLDPDLRRRMDSRARRESEKAEQQAAVLAGRRRRLADAVWEAAQHGRKVEVRAGAFQAEGTALHAQRDLLSLRTPRGGLEVFLPNVDALFIQSAASPVRSRPMKAESFAARLAEMQIRGEQVEVVGRGGANRFRGKLEAVARDYLALESPQGETLIPLWAVACVIRPRPADGALPN